RCLLLHQLPQMLGSESAGASIMPSGGLASPVCLSVEHGAPSVTGRNGPSASELENSAAPSWSSHASQNRRPSSRLATSGPSPPFGLKPTLLNRWLSTVN